MYPLFYNFRCENSRCIDSTQVCDLTDECGDSSDEHVASHCKDFIGCSFETYGNDPCNMTQDKSDDFDWYLGSSYTPSFNTGPTRDHTYGTSSGKARFILHEEFTLILSEPFSVRR